MFTGIVKGLAQVKSAEKKEHFLQLTLTTPAEWLQGLETGASIAINGVCLTVVAFGDDWVRFDVIDETLRLSNLGELASGHKVNFERSLQFGSEIGGHLVSGHVHCTAEVSEVQSSADNLALWLTLSQPALMKYILEKGFVAVDGASLTVGRVDGARFSLHLIPETLKLTRLGSIGVGDALNIEIDKQTQTIVDTVERVMAQRA